MLAHVDVDPARAAEEQRRQHILSDISRILLDYVGPDENEPLRRIVDKVVAGLGDWCAFNIIQPDGILKQVAAYHPDPRQREIAAKLNQINPPRRWDQGPPEHNVLVQKRPLYWEYLPDELLRRGAASEEAYRLTKQVGLTSLIAAPLIVGGEPLGTLVLASTGEGGRIYSQADIEFVNALTDRASLAVRNARLVRELAAERDKQREARNEAESRAAQLLAVFQADPNGIVLTDRDGVVQFASPSLERLFRVTPAELIGKPFVPLAEGSTRRLSPPDEGRIVQRLAQILADHSATTSEEIDGRLADGTSVAVRRMTVPILGADGSYQGRLFVFIDLSDERELDRQRAEFLTVAAHELRTPLTPLSMYLQSIERRLAQGKALEPEMAHKARRQVVRLSRLVEDLLDVSRLESGRLELAEDKFDLVDLIESVVSDFRAASPNHEIVLRRPPAGAPVAADKQRLEQVLVNLMANAIKYSPQGGRVTVAAHVAQGEVRVAVSDQGIGIPAEDQARLFQRFFRAKNATTRQFGGLGIGLFVSHEIVQRHGGRFEVDSQAGKGAAFSFTLPLDAAAKAAQSAASRILLVDDDPEILAATSEILREWGYAVDEARNGETALQLVRAARPDLLLVDLMMPVIDGWAFIERLRAEKLAPGVPIVVFSADRDAKEKGRKLDADASLRKPFELEELQATVVRLLDKGAAGARA